MKHQPKPQSQSPIANLRSLFNREKSPSEVLTAANLGAKLAQIQAAHGELVKGVRQYQAVAEKSVIELDSRIEGERRKMQAHRDEALKVSHLPDAMLAAELAAAERKVVTASCLQALRNVDSLSGDPELLARVNVAVNPLRELLAALPKQ